MELKKPALACGLGRKFCQNSTSIVTDWRKYANNIEPNQKQTQHERILAWFDTHASLTRWEALTFLGIWEAPARISELRKQGYDFHTKLEGGISESGYSFQSAVWTLER